MQRQLGTIGTVVLLALGTLVWCNHAVAEVTIELVTVGDAGNSADDTGYGAVDHVYRIGKYEISNAEYIEFLNAVAASDPNGLWTDKMVDSENRGGIAREGSDGSYTYGPRYGNGAYFNDRPVAFVDWYDCVRFCNWLHNGQPSGAQDSSTTEDGAYDLSLGGDSIVRKNGARYALPTEDEWYKAAFYKGGGTSAGYWEYATQSDAVPTAEAPPGGANSANYDSAFTPDPSPLSIVGSYSSSVSAYGTLDQNGNIFEWYETLKGPGLRGLRGGGTPSDETYMAASTTWGSYGPTADDSNKGFRIVALSPYEGTMFIMR